MVAALAGPVVETEPLDPLQVCIDTAGPARGIEGIPPADRIALVIGVPCHRTPTPGLRYSTRDAEQVATALGEHGWAVHQLTTLVDRADFERALDAVRAALPEHGELLVYFSGHGVLREGAAGPERYLVFSDTRLEDVEDSGLALGTLDAWLSAIPARHRTVVQDTCFAAAPSTNGKSLGGIRGAKSLELPHRSYGDADLRLFASRFYELALEDPTLEGSVYTHHWLAALDDPTADLDGDRCVSPLEAHLAATPGTSGARDGYQNPQWDGAPAPSSCEPPTHAVLLGPARRVEPGTRVRGVGRVRAGEWIREPTRSPAHLELSLAPELRTATTRGAAAIGLGADVVLGRRLGTRMGLRAEHSPTQPVASACFASQSVLGRLGIDVRRGDLTLSPLLEGGLTTRRASDCSVPVGPRQWGTLGGAALRGAWGRRLQVFATAGLWASPTRAPSIRAGLQPGLRLGVAFRP